MHPPVTKQSAFIVFNQLAFALTTVDVQYFTLTKGGITEQKNTSLTEICTRGIKRTKSAYIQMSAFNNFAVLTVLVVAVADVCVCFITICILLKMDKTQVITSEN